MIMSQMSLLILVSKIKITTLESAWSFRILQWIILDGCYIKSQISAADIANNYLRFTSSKFDDTDSFVKVHDGTVYISKPFC